MRNKIQVAMVGILAFFALAINAEATNMVLRFAHAASEDTSWHKGALKFAEEVKNLTHGEIDVRVYPNDTLGRLLDNMETGEMAFTLMGEGFETAAPKAALLAIPYVFQDLHQLDMTINGPLGAEISANILGKAKARPLAYFARGARYLTSNKPIKTPDDLKGLRMRVTTSPMTEKYWRGMGAAPLVLSLKEAHVALATRIVDAQENPLAIIKSAKFYEVQKYVNKTEHVRSIVYLAMSETVFKKLSPDQRIAVKKAAQIAQEFERKQFLADEEKLEGELKGKGMIFNEVDKKEFIQKAHEIVPSLVSDDMKPIVKKMYSSDRY